MDIAWEKHQTCYNPFKIHSRAYKCKFNGQQLAASKIGIITYLTKCPWRPIGYWNWKTLQKWLIFSQMISEKHVASFKNIFKIVLVLITPGRLKKCHQFYLQERASYSKYLVKLDSKRLLFGGLLIRIDKRHKKNLALFLHLKKALHIVSFANIKNLFANSLPEWNVLFKLCLGCWTLTTLHALFNTDLYLIPFIKH